MVNDMKCETVIEQIEDYVDGLASGKFSSELASHLDQCRSCEQARLAHVAYKKQMAAFEVPALSAEKTEALLASVRSFEAQSSETNGRVVAQSHWHGTSFVSGFAAAMVFAVVAFLGVQAINETTPVNTGQIAESSVLKGIGLDDQARLAANQTSKVTKDVTVVIYVPVDLEGAEISLDLPEYMALKEYEGMRTLSWQTDLSAGPNQLVLPVVVAANIDDSKEHFIAATIEYKNKQKTFQLPVKLAG